MFYCLFPRLAGLFRHHLASDLTRAASGTTAVGLVNGSLNGRIEVGSPPGEIHVNSKIVANGPTQQQASSTTNSGENALDYTNRCYANQQPKIEPQSEASIYSCIDSWVTNTKNVVFILFVCFQHNYN